MSQQQLEQLSFTCAACGKQFRWKPEFAGRSVTCKCSAAIRVPKEPGGVAQLKTASGATAAPAAAPAAGAAGAKPVIPAKAIAKAATSPGLAAAAKAAEVPPRAPAAPAEPATKPGKAGASAATISLKPTSHQQPPPPPPPAPAAQQKQAAAPPPPPPPAAAPADDDGFDGLYALAQQEAATADDASEAADAARCANCRGFMAPEAVLCTSCGFDRRKGKVLAAAKAEGPKRGLFGFGKPKKVDPNKKQVVDKMAPQGSFMVGLAGSVILALAAAALWFGVAYGTGLDVYYLVALVGAAAGVGMQLGQKGYSTSGGLAAAGITVAVMLAARAAVLFLVVLPMIDEQLGGDSGEDPRVVMMLMGEQYLERGLDPERTTDSQDEQVRDAAVKKARTLSAAEKQELIATAQEAGIADADGVDLRDEVIGTGPAAIVTLIAFGGVKPFFFMLAALFLAFRTASGSVTG